MSHQGYVRDWPSSSELLAVLVILLITASSLIPKFLRTLSALVDGAIILQAHFSRTWGYLRQWETIPKRYEKRNPGVLNRLQLIRAISL